MCVFCAAGTAIAATGIAVDGEQRKKNQARQARGETPTRPRVPIAPATFLALVAVLMASVLYHSQGNL